MRILREHIDEFGSADDGRLFRNECSGIIGSATYSRTWEEARHLACTPGQVTAKPHPPSSPSGLAAARKPSAVGEAIPLHERALADYERVLGESHPDTLGSWEQPCRRLPCGGPGWGGGPAV